MNNGYKTKFVPQLISLNSDFSSATWSMTALSAGTDDIVDQSNVLPEEASGITEEINRRLNYANGKMQIADLLFSCAS